MNKRITIGLGAAAAVLLAGGAAVYAHEAGEHGPMKMFDGNGDGTITRAEARSAAAAMFAQADADKDGRVTMDEMRAFHGRMGDHHRGGHGPGGEHRGPPPGEPGEGRPGGPMHLDSNGDGAVTLAEAQDGIERHLAALDTDKNGAVSRDEIEAAHRGHHAR